MKITPKGVINFLGATGRIAEAAIDGDQILVDSDTKNKRLEICKSCTHNVENQCEVCECLIRAKALLATETCPKGKW